MQENKPQGVLYMLRNIHSVGMQLSDAIMMYVLILTVLASLSQLLVQMDVNAVINSNCLV